ncbi:MAG TPA: ComF family protein [Burkholderiales bacterium]|jgi:ComF family protein|nr:ComF family protein [Burkholderiales bacterium]
MLARPARRLAGLLFGGSCFLCRGAAEELLCARCDAELPRLGARCCPRCALESPSGEVCGRCLARPPAFDATAAALAYRFPADVLVQALKFHSELSLAALFGRLLEERVARSERVDHIVPVPLFARRLKERGFNQAMEIARPLARASGARLAPELCERIRDTPAQLGLPLEERRRNVAGAFRCPALVAGASIALVDDVMTTGSTLDEVAATLKRAGAARVVNWVVARTPPPD